jgi:hypothetical protein
MIERIFWLPAIVMLGLFAAGDHSLALAKGGGHAGSVRGFGVQRLGVQRPGARGLGVRGSGAVAFQPAPFVRVPPRLIRDNVAPRAVPRQYIVGNDRLLRRGDRFENDWPIGIWPFWPGFDAIPMVAPSNASDDPANPPVIVVSGSPNDAPERMASATLPDYSYVAGCHAIPNGYHCDVPHDAAAAR